MKQLCMFALVLITFVAAPNAFAKKGKGKAAGPVTARSDIFVKYDMNYNSTLDESEKAAIIKDFDADKTGPLKALDTNSDGKLSTDELAAIPATKLSDAPAKGKGKGKKNK